MKSVTDMSLSDKINQLRNSTGLNRKEFCLKTGIPYMTMTDWELGKHDMPEYVLRMLEYYLRLEISDIEKNMFSDGKCHKWEEQKNYRTIFPVLVPHEKVATCYIHPYKQKTAVLLHEVLSRDDRIVSSVLFGSSVTMRCRVQSDIDIAIRLLPEYITKDTKNEISETVAEITDWNNDIIWFDRVNSDDLIYRNIMKGVQIV